MRSRIRLAALTLPVLLAAHAQAQTSDAARKTILAVADSALAAINRGDPVALSDLMTPEATTMSVRAIGDTTRYRVRTRAEVRAQAQQNKITERGFNGEVRVSGPLATVWLPYDLYIDGNWSHCGVDVLTLMQVDKKWKIANFSWTVEQPPACQKHPDGPPRKN